jgi:hypothetical protein
MDTTNPITLRFYKDVPKALNQCFKKFEDYKNQTATIFL